ncbi:MAG TPA: thioredoxin family protein [Gemmatimonadaceae bacterium]
MTTVKVLGTGCPSCKATAKLIEEVAHAKGRRVTVEKVEAVQDIMRYGIMSTPGVVIGDAVVHAGGVPARAKVESWFD